MRIELNNDNLGYVEIHDFSKANVSLEARVKAVTDVASICVGNMFSKKPENLFNRLSKESNSLPSSSFEFCPILLKVEDDLPLVKEMSRGRIGGTNNHYLLDVEKYGERVEGHYLLTNLRALIADVGADNANNNFFNTRDLQQKIIKAHFKVFKAKIDIATARQFMRHRTVWQELSRRFTKNKKQKFEFYTSQDIINANIKAYGTVTNIQAGYQNAVDSYEMMLMNGVKAEDARRVLPLSLYTTVWSAWLPSSFNSMIALRTDHHSQQEMQWLAEGMRTLANTEYNTTIMNQAL